MRGTTVLSAAVAITVLASTAGWCWDIEPVYTEGLGVGDTSLAIGPSNVPVISYAADDSLFVATKTIEGWSFDRVASCGAMGGWSSIAIEPATGLPTVAFVDVTNFGNYLRYAFRTGASWSVENVGGIGWLPDSVSLSASTVPCIAYGRATDGFPMQTFISFAQRTGPDTWLSEDIAEVGFPTAPSLLVIQDNYHVAFPYRSVRQVPTVPG